MILTVKPAASLEGTVLLPSSKSYTIRAFLVAACGGKSTIINPSNSLDAKVSIRVARCLGARVKKITEDPLSQWHVEAAQKQKHCQKFDVKESGTTLRFLLPLAALRGKKAVITGQGTLYRRPNAYLTNALRDMGVDIRGTGRKESVPIHIKGGAFKRRSITINGGLSSQFISALLIACPQLPHATRLWLKGRRLVSTDYIAMTCQVLKRSGIVIKKEGPRDYRINGHQTFKGLKDFMIPSDYGLAAFLMAAASLMHSHVRLKGFFRTELVQADAHILFFLKQMGVDLQTTATEIQIHGPFFLKGGNFSLAPCPDLLPIMAVLALFARGPTCLYNIAHARSKESDRIRDLSAELLKIGARITEKRDAIIIHPQKVYKKNCLLDPHHDHRLAMSFCVLGVKLGVRIKDIECTRKSYPDFVADLKRIGIRVSKS